MNDDHSIVLIVHPGTLGDVLLAIEAIRGIRRTFPSHRLVWIGQSEVGKLLVASREVDEVYGIEGRFLPQLLTRPRKLDNRTKHILERCSHCVFWMTDYDGALSSNLKSFGIRCIIQSPHSHEDRDVHYEEKFFRTLHPWGVTVSIPSDKEGLSILNEVSPHLASNPMRNLSGSLDALCVVVHPGSGSRHKCVSPALLGELTDRLFQTQGRRLVILSGPDDHSQVDSLLHAIHVEDYELVANQPILTVASVLKKAALYIGHDSGISHLAAAVGVPSIVLFGPTNPASWAPRGPHVRVVRGPACQCAAWEQVQQCELKPCFRLSVDQLVHEAECALAPLEGRSQIHSKNVDAELHHQNK